VPARVHGFFLEPRMKEIGGAVSTLLTIGAAFYPIFDNRFISWFLVASGALTVAFFAKKSFPAAPAESGSACS
jgi:hypothetical protein